ncbi:UNVERIFIED_CONTAM: putative acyl-[acyl-carrier-protein]--UDP-N-acetylglucosamine O-acyltransferase, mitochondrial [Sesamum angustifolium]|uniref:Acyl-[acyl-carrier-protein]--UDP-N-acetylglucosamine O-acyltransferase, mitochondrial n=1 Tax=Sesamum angustifolium TaxID=2727405 RepID=A0AAW2N5I9_9LAMI
MQDAAEGEGMDSSCASRVRNPILLGLFRQTPVAVGNDPSIRRMNQAKPPQFLPVCKEGRDLKCGKWGNLDDSLSFLPPSVTIVASSNGCLLCCTDQIKNMDYVVCNPVTREFHMLPQPHRLYPYTATAFICKGDNESLTGLCYEIYRARVASAVSLATTLELDIFSSTTGEWTQLSLIAASPFQLSVHLGPPLVFDDVIYWRSYSYDYMIEYDPTRELVQLKPLPERGQNFRIWSDHIGQSEGKIQYARADNSEIEVWVLEDIKKGEWTMTQRVSVEAMFQRNPHIVSTIYIGIQHFHPRNQLLILITFDGRPYWYNCRSGRLSAFRDVNEEEKFSSTGTGTNCNFIHPSAVVHPNAILGCFNWSFLYCGTFCEVGECLSAISASHVSGKTELGDNCILMMGAVVGDELPGHTLIGCNNIIGHHAVVGIKCQDMKYKPGSECFLQIGDNNEIREYASVHRSSMPNERTIIGDNNLIMGSCHIAHDCKVGNNNIFANNTLLAGHVVVEDFTHTAGATVIHQFCHIGSFSFIGGGSVVSQDVPKYTMVSGERAELRGLNLEGLRRCGFSVVEVKSLRAAYRKIFMPADGNFRSIEDRLTELEKDEKLNGVPAVCFLLQSIRDSFAEERRGICKFRSWAGS